MATGHEEESLYSQLTKDARPWLGCDPSFDEKIQALRDKLFNRLWLKEPELLKDEEQIRRILRDLVVEEGLPTTMIDVLMKDIFGFGPISELMGDPLVTDIWIDGYDCIYYEKEGKVLYWKKGFASEEALRRFVTRLASSTGRKIDEARPVEDFRLSDGSRVIVFLDGISVRGTSVAIRRFARLFTLQELADREMFLPE